MNVNTNINISDPADVKALLDKLRSSQAWKEATSTHTQPTTESPGSSQLQRKTAPATDSGSSVASLLSQLQTPQKWTQASVPVTQNIKYTPAATYSESSSQGTIPTPHVNVTESIQKPDLKSYTYQNALPLLAQLADNPSFIAALTKVKKEQDDLERQLWQDRCAIQKKYEDRVNVAKTKANVIGTGITKHEADMINDAYKKELDKFDQERALPAWDGLVTKQQTMLAQLGVPTMFATADMATRERQQKVMQVIEGFLGGEMC